MYETHEQPGRRFAPGSSRGDQIRGAFGFTAHATLFMALGSAAAGRYGRFFWLNAVTAGVLLGIRAHQVGSTTTKESLKAIDDAWGVTDALNRFRKQSSSAEVSAER